MARYLYGAILTGPAVASNNRGENSGNMAMLQHVFWGGHDHTTVSSEAIRFAMQSALPSRKRSLGLSPPRSLA